MSGVRDFFCEFYTELEIAMENYVNHKDETSEPSFSGRLDIPS